MSLRHIRKVLGGPTVPTPEEGGDDFEPVYQKTTNLYAGLMISSNSESEANDSDDAEPKIHKPATPKSVGKKKKKKGKKSKSKNDIDTQPLEMDEIDRCVSEVNSMLGEPSRPQSNMPKEDPHKIRRDLFLIQPKYLDPEAELTRRFGPDPDEDKAKKRMNPRGVSRKAQVIQTDVKYTDIDIYMTVVERIDDCIYFTFKHNKLYQVFHNTFLVLMQSPTPATPEFDIRHFESMLQFADWLYSMEDYTEASKVIREIIISMEQAVHPLFSITNVRVRLEYKYAENRVFHIALMKYMYALTIKACHRTALEVAKILLNLDPADPLAVLFIIDTIAIRAKEYHWLVKAIEYWTKERDAGYLFNIMYSLALAEFHIGKKHKDKEKLLEADRLITKAILHFPSIVPFVLKKAGVREPKVFACKLFDTEIDDGSSKNLKDLLNLYCSLTWNNYIEQSVMSFFLKNVLDIVERYDTGQLTKKHIEDYANLRRSLYQGYPPEVLRHLCIISPMNNLVADGAVPKIENIRSHDPYPPHNGISPYREYQNLQQQ